MSDQEKQADRGDEKPNDSGSTLDLTNVDTSAIPTIDDVGDEPEDEGDAVDEDGEREDEDEDTGDFETE